MDCGLWWLEQSQANYRYVTGLFQKDPTLAAAAASRMVMNAEKWGSLTKLAEAGPLMKYHVGALKRLADSAFTKHRRGIELGINEAVYNEKLQTELYSRAFARFPEKAWHDLFTLYITGTGGYTLALAGADTADFRKQRAIVQDAKVRIAQLWADVCDANCLK